MKTGNLWEEFEWHRAVDGYRWIETPQGPALTSVQQAAPLRTVSYRPFSKEHSGLFRVFADLKPTADAVLAFANRYGLLGYPVSSNFWKGKQVSVTPPAGPYNAYPFQPHELARVTGGYVGELLSLKGPPPYPEAEDWCWTAQIGQMALVQNPAHFLGEAIIAMVHQSTINIRLEKTIGPYLAWSAATHSFHLRMRPLSLIGALWLQAAFAIAERKIFRDCRVCGHPIEISRSGGARTDALFCSNKCKTRDYRQRVTKAQKLARRGELTPAQIAKRLRTDAETVRRWLR